jgi:ATP-dependent helicase/nuclease subunit A
VLATDPGEDPAPLPDWVSAPPPPAARRPQPLRPSGLGGAKALPGEGEETDAAMARGTLLHRLLELLPGVPPATWPAWAGAMAADAGLLAEAVAVLSDPALSVLFGPDSLAEVPVAAPWNDRVLLGSIDRLVLAPDRVLAVDFKSNRLVPERAEDVPDGLLRQMGAYAHALAQVWPGRRVDTAILWTRTARLMPLPHDIVREALGRATIP